MRCNFIIFTTIHIQKFLPYISIPYTYLSYVTLYMASQSRLVAWEAGPAQEHHGKRCRVASSAGVGTKKPPGEKEVKPRGNKKEVMKSQLNGVHCIGRIRPLVFPFEGNLPRNKKRIKRFPEIFIKFFIRSFPSRIIDQSHMFIHFITCFSPVNLIPFLLNRFTDHIRRCNRPCGRSRWKGPGNVPGPLFPCSVLHVGRLPRILKHIQPEAPLRVHMVAFGYRDLDGNVDELVVHQGDQGLGLSRHRGMDCMRAQS